MTDRDRGVYAPPLRNEPGFGPVAGTAEERRRGPLLLGVTLAVLFALIGVIWSSYNQGVREGGREAPPRITASAEPIKVAPEDPGGEDTAYLDMRVFDMIEETEGETATAAAPLEGEAVPIDSHGLEDWEIAEPASATAHAAAPAEAAPEDDPADDPEITVAALEPSPRLKPLPRSAEAEGAADEPRADRPRTLADASEATAAAPAADEPADEDAAPEDEEVEVAAARDDGGATAARAAAPEPASVIEVASATPSITTTTRGAFLVQIASFRSLDAADAGWASFEAEFSDMLRGRGRDVARADLGDRGVHYRVRVGGFGDREAASSFCDRLKSRGQECLVVGS